MRRNSYDNWPPYVPVAERRRKAAQTISKMKRRGGDISPIEIAGRKIALTFWGDAWCKNLEAYSDYANRLPRGRTYVRNGSVIDLKVSAGRVCALVSGSDLYEVDIEIKRLAKRQWNGIKHECAGHIDSLIELLKGSLSKNVMEIVTRKGKGLFPSPSEISLACSCPDWATMCKHVAATLYAVGARLDHQPELLFMLRGVEPTEMVDAAASLPPQGESPNRKVLRSDELSVFGIDIDGVVAPAVRGLAKRAARTRTKATKASKSGKGSGLRDQLAAKKVPRRKKAAVRKK